MKACATYRNRTFLCATNRHIARAALIIVAAGASLSFSAPPSVVVTRLTDLGFGDVATASTKQILHTDAEAASFRVDATGVSAQTGIRLIFTLPTALTGGGDVLPITFAADDAAWNYSNNSGGVTTFDPSTGTFVSKQGTNFTLFVRIGGRVTADGTTTLTTYTSSLTLDVEVQ